MSMIEGYWAKSSKSTGKLPWPEGKIRPWKGQKTFETYLRAVQKIAKSKGQKGSSKCRLCGCTNGSYEFYYGEYRWPEGLLHYIEVHNVKPSDTFINFIHKVYMGKIYRRN